ncbi:hypothetical protein [Streptomyces sp. NPDC052107]|uniref:hypothetical protein n=1 Tax=Streptomyces sp. NPDC052107 TaxID=3155632 RepID=UPI00343E43C4
MTSAPRHRRYGRALGVGTLSVALLSGGTAGAFAVTSAQAPAPSPTRSSMLPVRPPITGTGKPSMKPSRAPAAMGSITLSANRKVIKVGNTVVFTGRVTGVRSGSTLVLQHMHNGKWTTLNYSAVVSKSGRYTIKRTFTDKGTHQLRVMSKSSTIHSSPVTVKVS